MDKRLLFFTLAILTFASVLFASTDEIIFMEYGMNYSAAISPVDIENNDTGVYDTMAFDAKIGGALSRWVDIYAGGSFFFFDERKNMQQHYTFFPIYIGARVNIFPDAIVYPDFSFEIGKTLSNYHTQVVDKITMVVSDKDASWLGNYYSFGGGLNLNIADIAILSLRVERPSITNDLTGAEMHFIKTGFAWKIFY